jgi:hypothetical protein
MDPLIVTQRSRPFLALPRLAIVAKVSITQVVTVLLEIA